MGWWAGTPPRGASHQFLIATKLEKAAAVDRSKQFRTSVSNDSAYDGKEDGPAADEVDEDEDLLPPVSANFSFLRLLDDDVGHVGQHLKSRSLVETRPFCSRTQL